MRLDGIRRSSRGHGGSGSLEAGCEDVWGAGGEIKGVETHEFYQSEGETNKTVSPLIPALGVCGLRSLRQTIELVEGFQKHYYILRSVKMCMSCEKNRPCRELPGTPRFFGTT